MAEATVAPARGDIAGIVLAGGEGRRMGGVDKGLIAFEGRALVEHVIARLRPQVASIVVVANRNTQRYAAWADRVVADQFSDSATSSDSAAVSNGTAGRAGPLAGMHAGLAASDWPYVLCVPCDAPWLPADLAARLGQALVARNAMLAYARTGTLRHPVFALMRRDCLASLTAFVAAGGRRVEAWFATLPCADVDFDDERAAFRNLNRPEDLDGA